MTPQWDRFDGVYVLGFTGMKDRMATMRAELERVGLSGKAETVWNFHNPYDGVLARTIRMETREKYINCCMGHYRIIKTAYELGMESVLILEDDARFLSDIGGLCEGIAELPGDFGVAMLDHHLVRPETRNESRSGKWWSDCRDKRVSSAAYALSRDAMEWILREYESPLSDGGHGLMCCDQMFDRWMIPETVGFIVATPNLAIQVPNKVCTTPGNDLPKRYGILGVDMEDYG